MRFLCLHKRAGGAMEECRSVLFQFVRLMCCFWHKVSTSPLPIPIPLFVSFYFEACIFHFQLFRCFYPYCGWLPFHTSHTNTFRVPFFRSAWIKEINRWRIARAKSENHGLVIYPSSSHCIKIDFKNVHHTTHHITYHAMLCHIDQDGSGSGLECYLNHGYISISSLSSKEIQFPLDSYF